MRSISLRLAFAFAFLAAFVSFSFTLVDSESLSSEPRRENAAFSPSATCTYAITPTSASSVAAEGATGTFTVTAGAGCAWSVAVNDPWISVTSGSSGTGSGTVGYRIAANFGVPRTGTLLIGDQIFTISQAAASSCGSTVLVTLPNASGASGGQLTVPVMIGDTTGTNIVAYDFNVSFDPNVIRPSAVQYDTSGTLSSGYTITPNSGTSGRLVIVAFGTQSLSGAGILINLKFDVIGEPGAQSSLSFAHLTLNEGSPCYSAQSGTVTVESPGCTFALGATSLDVGAALFTGGVQVNTSTSSCKWTSTSNVSWIVVMSGSSGTGQGSASYTVLANTGPPRSGTVTVGGQLLTINQLGGCTYSLSPSSVNNVPLGGATGSFSVSSSQSGCAWTASSSDSWITITSGASGTGNGTVGYAISANTGSARAGTITVGGQTFTVNQLGCSYSLSPSGVSSVSAAGATGTFNITPSSSGCTWSATTSDSWISVTSGSSGTGTGTVGYSVSANTGIARSGAITAGGRTFSINQLSGCTYALSPVSVTDIASAGASGTFALTSGTGCTWTATSNVSWITISSGSSGTGSGTVGYTVAANSGPQRNGTITAGGRTFTVTQVNGCTYSLSSSSANIVAAGASGTFGVTSSNNTCTWTAVSGDSWIAVTSGSSGVGNGTVGYTVAANTGPQRSGTVIAGGQTFAITQTSGCTYSLGFSSANIAATGASGTVGVTSNNSSCAWTATSNSSWITITSGSSGTGNGSVGYTVAANTGPQRTGTVTAAGQTFTVTQANGCTYSLSPSYLSGSNVGGTSSINVTAGTGCAWTASTSDSWISITSGASGSGNGSVGFSYTANSGSSRSGTITIGGQTFRLNQSSADSCIPVSTGDYTASAQSILTVPLTVSDLTGREVTAFQFELRFDSTVVRPSADIFDATATLSNAFSIVANADTPGVLVIAGYGTNALSGSGTLIKLKFDVVGARSSQTSLNYQYFRFNEGSPCNGATPGTVTVRDIGDIGGNVTYHFVQSGSTGAAVPNVTLTAAGSPQRTVSTNASGAYLITELGAGAYNVTPSKAGDINGISSLDASRAAQFAVGLVTLTPTQQIAADASGNGQVTSFDASQIARYVVLMSNTGQTGTWKFTPSTRAYASVPNTVTGENYTAILVGDVTGNWAAPVALAEASASLLEDALAKTGETFPLALRGRRGQTGEVVRIPVTVGDITNKGITAFDMELSYDPEVLEPVTTDNAGALSANFIVTANATTPGRLIVSAYGIAPISGGGTLVNLVFRVKGEDGATTPLRFEKLLLNEDSISAPDGTFTVGRESRGIGPTFRKK